MLNILRQVFKENKIDALLVTESTNCFALTGFKASNCILLITKNHAYIFTDSRYTEKAESIVSKEWRVEDIAAGLLDTIHKALMRHKVKYLGFESRHVSHAMYKKLQTLFGVKIIPTDQLVEKVRIEKSEIALRNIRQSQKLNEQVLKLALQELKPGITEEYIAWQICCLARKIGAQGCSFDPIVAFGAHSARPHHEVSRKKKLRRGDIILIDMGVMYKGYASDMTRTFFTKVPTSQQAEVYETVLEANKRATKMVMPGIKSDEVDKAARKYISDMGYGGKFGHATGHGIGLNVHELPVVAKGVDMELIPSSVITIEPGIYIPKKLGVRIEDMVEVTTSGHKVLTKALKDIKSVQIKV